MPAPDVNASLAEWLAWQESLHARPVELGLSRVHEVAARLGLPCAIPTLTVAGTNGKGSSTTLLGEIYRAAGLRTGVYTSPHLMRYNERVAIDGQPVPDSELCTAFAAIERARREISLTYFEFGTLAALWIFRESGVRIQILEVGLGGRLDAVNLVDADGMLITAIGLDHQDWLGSSREAIAREKAGILRAGRPAVYADLHPIAEIDRQAMQIRAPLLRLGRDFSYRVAADAWNWFGATRSYKKLPMPGLGGEHQLCNAAGVVTLVECLQPRIAVSESAIRTALPRLHLPGRFERHGRVILDVAHNVEAIEALCEQLRAHGLDQLILVLGMLADKPVEAVSKALSPLVSEALLVSLPGPRGLSAATLQQRTAGAFRRARCCDTIAGALHWAQSLAGEQRHVLVCGSFLTVSAVKELQGHLHG